MTEIIGLIIGVLIAAYGLYYFTKGKNSPESRKIYGAAIVIGLAVAAVCAAIIVLPG